jgi:hypothetical protein
MPTNFPTSVDNFTNPTANDSLNLPSHSTQHANANDAIEAIETFALALPRGAVAQVNSNTGFATSSATHVDITGMSVSFTGNTTRKYRATFTAAQMYGTSNERASLRITGTNISQSMTYYMAIQGAFGSQLNGSVIFVASTNGTTTVKVQLNRDTGSNPVTIYADPNSPMHLFVEDIGAV